MAEAKEDKLHWIVENSKKVLNIISDSDSERKIVFERRFRKTLSISGSVQSLTRAGSIHLDQTQGQSKGPRAWPSPSQIINQHGSLRKPKLPPKPPIKVLDP